MLEYVIACYNRKSYDRVRKSLEMSKIRFTSKGLDGIFYIMTARPPETITKMTGWDIWRLRRFVWEAPEVAEVGGINA